MIGKMLVYFRGRLVESGSMNLRIELNELVVFSTNMATVDFQ
jgi:hypothetical protein